MGARRLADAATALAGIGLDRAAAIATGQARLVGSLQHDLVTGGDEAAAGTLRRLAPAYLESADALG
ncbi:hypothetical protein [Actinoplanes xinjiangensis]|uniref:hypothetical protein n=1 Tax=Actinoplanes xinjiangensis TaxID=512350 RepID=UPI00341EF8A1